MKKLRLNSNRSGRKVACTVSAAALMLGASQAATVGFNIQTLYCSSAGYSGAVVTASAFGIAPGGWQSLTPLITGYSCGTGVCGFSNLTEVINTSTSGNGLNPLPNGSLTVSWGAYAANVSGFGGYNRSGPHYEFGGNNEQPGNEQVYWGFLRDGVNFGPLPDGTCGFSSGDNDQPGYNIDITGLKSLFTNSSFAVELIASSDSLWTLTNAFIIDATANTTQSVVYPNIPTPRDQGGTLASGGSFMRGIGGGLSTGSGSFNTDHLKIIGNRAQHTTNFNNASTICGWIITDKPVISMSPQPSLVCVADTVVWSGYAVGVPPLSYQWRKNGSAIAGATNTSFSITNVSARDLGTYDLLVTNLYGSAVSAGVSPDHLSISEGKNYVVDSNTNGPPLDGMDFGATWLATNGTRSGVMSFSASNSNQIVVPGHTNLDASVGAIMFWMRSSGLLVSTNNPAILFDRRTGSGLVLAQASSGQIMVQTAPRSALDFTSVANVSDGNWHHVALVFNQASGLQVTLYIDGVPDTMTPNGADWAWPAGQELEFGLSHDSFWQAYNGQLDDIRFYNTSLSDADILAIFTTGAPLNNSGNILRLNFDTAPVRGVTLRWQCPEAILQSADSVAGPYTDMPYAVSGYDTSLRTTKKFYRYHALRTPTTVIANPYLM